MNENLWKIVKDKLRIKSEAKFEPKPVVRPMEPGITAALKGKVTPPPTGEAAEPLSHGDGSSLIHGKG